jgi:energy-coupling factor transporter transmembrane protein EcfT
LGGWKISASSLLSGHGVEDDGYHHNRNVQLTASFLLICLIVFISSSFVVYIFFFTAILAYAVALNNAEELCCERGLSLLEQ